MADCGVDFGVFVSESYGKGSFHGKTFVIFTEAEGDGSCQNQG